MTPRRSWILAAVLPLAALTACGGDDDDAGFCTPMEELANFNADAPTPDLSSDFETLKTELLATYQSSLDLYDEPIANAPDEIADELATLREVSEEFMGELEAADSIEDFQASTLDLADSEVLDATSAVDDYIRENCGFGLTSG